MTFATDHTADDNPEKDYAAGHPWSRRRRRRVEYPVTECEEQETHPVAKAASTRPSVTTVTYWRRRTVEAGFPATDCDQP